MEAANLHEAFLDGMPESGVNDAEVRALLNQRHRIRTAHRNAPVPP